MISLNCRFIKFLKYTVQKILWGVFDRRSWMMPYRDWKCVTHCACHYQVNSPGSLFVTEVMICSAWGIWATRQCFWLSGSLWWELILLKIEMFFFFFSYLGMKGGGAGEMWVAPRSQSSICTKRDSLILSQICGEGGTLLPQNHANKLRKADFFTEVFAAVSP